MTDYTCWGFSELVEELERRDALKNKKNILMQKQEIKATLNALFVPRNKGLEGVCFRMDFMNKENASYPVYKKVSEAMHDSGLSHDFSYEIANIAVDILTELRDWENDDQITEAVDGAVPIYTHDLMRIYTSDSGAVDEGAEELGTDGDSVARAQAGWYIAIQHMVNDIKNRLGELDND